MRRYSSRCFVGNHGHRSTKACGKKTIVSRLEAIEELAGKVYFKDGAGVDEAKQELGEVIEFLHGRF